LTSVLLYGVQSIALRRIANRGGFHSAHSVYDPDTFEAVVSNSLMAIECVPLLLLTMWAFKPNELQVAASSDTLLDDDASVNHAAAEKTINDNVA
jgi:hypothetical protein